MAAGDLTTVEKVRDFLGLTDTSADTKIAGYVTSSSKWVVSQLGRPILTATYTETHNGDGGQVLVLDKWPVNSVTSVTVDGDAVPARATVDDTGYVIDGTTIRLVGYYFTKGTANVVVVYRAGYEATEAITIPATPGPYTVTAGSRVVDAVSASLTVAGTALVEVASSPADGQYSVAGSVYTFNAAQQGLAASITYSVVPQDLEQAVTEHAALRYRDADRTGLASASIAGESASYSPAGALAYINGVLDLYREPAVA